MKIWVPEYLRWVRGRGLLWAAVRVLLVALGFFVLFQLLGQAPPV